MKYSSLRTNLKHNKMIYKIRRFSVTVYDLLGRLRNLGYGDGDIKILEAEFNKLTPENQEKLINTTTPSQEIKDYMEETGLDFPAAFLETVNTTTRHGYNKSKRPKT